MRPIQNEDSLYLTRSQSGVGVKTLRGKFIWVGQRYSLIEMEL